MKVLGSQSTESLFDLNLNLDFYLELRHRIGFIHFVSEEFLTAEHETDIGPKVSDYSNSNHAGSTFQAKKVRT